MVRLTHLGGPTVLIEARRMAHPHRPHLRPARRHLPLRAGHVVDQDDWAGARAGRPGAHGRHPAQPRPPRRQPGRPRPARPGPRRHRADHRPGRPTARWRHRARAASGHRHRAAGRRRRPALRVRATPCRHGPPLSRPLTGAVIGFALSLGERQPSRRLDDRRHRAPPAAPTHRQAARRRHPAHASGQRAVPDHRTGSATP